MCLVINLYRHPTLKPLVAKNDIHVHKILARDVHNNYFTYVLNYPVVFSNGIAILEACLDKPKRVSVAGELHYIIKKGIHSSSIPPGFYHAKKAIIPKGTRYYIGEDNDMVSEKLIIYE